MIGRPQTSIKNVLILSNLLISNLLCVEAKFHISIIISIIIIAFQVVMKGSKLSLSTAIVTLLLFLWGDALQKSLRIRFYSASA